MVTIAQFGSLSRAAARFYLAQPALSRILHNMEEMLGHDLFTREHNRLRPTNAGKIFVNSARNMLRIEAEVETYIKSYRQGHGERLFVHCDAEIAEAFRSKAEPGFSHACPEVSIALMEGNSKEIREALLNASADIGIFMTCEKEHPVLRQRVLCETELVYCVSSAEDARKLGKDGVLTGMLPGRRMMLAPDGTTLRHEQDEINDALYMQKPKAVCHAELPLF